MTNLNKLTLAITASLFALTTANAAVVFDKDGDRFEVGGRVQANINSVNASSDKDKADIETGARLRVNGKSKINDQFAAIGFGEWQVAAQNTDGNKFKARYAYVGVKSNDYGVLTFGQDRGAFFNVSAATDLFIDWGKKVILIGILVAVKKVKQFTTMIKMILALLLLIKLQA